MELVRCGCHPFVDLGPTLVFRRRLFSADACFQPIIVLRFTTWCVTSVTAHPLGPNLILLIKRYKRRWQHQAESGQCLGEILNLFMYVLSRQTSDFGTSNFSYLESKKYNSKIVS